MQSIIKSTLTTKHLIKYWLPAILWGIVIFSFSSHPTGTVSPTYWQDVVIKKSAHMVEYAIFVTLFYRAFLNSGNSKVKSIRMALAIAVAYAFTDEFHQSFTPTREPHIRDVIFDTIGGSIASLFIWKYLPRLP